MEERADGAAFVGDRSVNERILDSAELVLQRNGYAGFTTRRVAEAACIAPGNLSYHYPTKLELLRAVIKRITLNYSDRFEETLRLPANGLEFTIRLIMRDAASEEASALFRELWAMALHDSVVRDAIDEMYDHLISRVENSLRSTYPEAEPQDIRDLVQLLTVISEGSVILYGTSRSRRARQERLVELVLRLTSLIISEPLR